MPFSLSANVIDVLGFFRVINYSVPETSETYTLRTGHKTFTFAVEFTPAISA